MAPQTPWSLPDRYSIIIIGSSDEKRCIAPIIKNAKDPERTRCNRSPSFADFAKAKRLESVIRTRDPTFDSDNDLRTMVLLRTCHQHRLKLEDAGQCLDALAERYANQFFASPTAPNPPVLRDDVDPVVISTPGTPAPIPSNVVEQPQRRYNLRSGGSLAEGNTDSNGTRRQHQTVPRPYLTKARKPINAVFQGQASHVKKKSGWVYAFSCPSLPGFVKIGYTADSVRNRFDEHRECYSDAVLLHERACSFPAQIERLIHLELRDARYRMKCATCFRTHQEWFNLAADVVKRIVDGWADLGERSPLYGQDGWLSSAWRARRQRFSPSITAQELHCLLDEEMFEAERVMLATDATMVAMAQATTVLVGAVQSAVAMSNLLAADEVILTAYREFMALADSQNARSVGVAH